MGADESACDHVFPKPKSLLDVPREAASIDSLAAAIRSIDQHDQFLHAFVPGPDRLGRMPLDMNCDRSSSVLQGALVGVKDVIRVDGLETRAGSMLPPESFIGPQATVIDRLEEAGAIVAGKTATAEFAVSAPGPTLNPQDLTRTPGGSSSGSAAAVAAGLVPLAIGTQTVGSIIRPAAFCGVVGFRPTWGTIPTDGVIANAPSLDTIGFFASDVASINLAAGILCNWQERELEGKGSPILGVPTGDYLGSASPEGLRAFRHHVRLLRESGYEVREAHLPSDLSALHRNLTIFQRFELAAVHTVWWRDYATLYHPTTAAAIRQGRQITSREYHDAAAWRTVFQDELANTMNKTGITIWVTPSAPGLAPHGLASTGNAVMSAPFSFAGLPAISLPAPNPVGGIPFGLQCVAAEQQDQTLLNHAHKIAEALKPQPFPSPSMLSQRVEW